MAATFAPNAAFNYALQMIKSMPLDRVETSILQDASSLIWMAAPWRWTIGIAAPVAVSAGANTVTIAVPSDFLRLERVLVTNGNSARFVKIVGEVQGSTILSDWPKFVAVTGTPGGAGALNFDTLFPSSETGWQVWFWYKKMAPVITSGNQGTGGVLVMDDEWFWVYNETVLYYAYKYADDPRAGTSEAAISDGGAGLKYSGQIGRIMTAIEEMRRSEVLMPEYPELYPTPTKSR